jgi:hypothetical protein
MSQGRWKYWLAGLIGLSILISGLFGLSAWYRSPIQYENFDQIRPGMTLAEVEALLGCPPGDYRKCEIAYALDDIDFPINADEARWQGSQGDLMIFHDENKIVVGKSWAKGEPEALIVGAMHWFVDNTLRKR